MEGIRIIAIRRRAGLRQRDVAEALGLAPERLSEMECGHRPIPSEFERKVHDAVSSILRNRLAAVGRRRKVRRRG